VTAKATPSKTPAATQTATTASDSPAPASGTTDPAAATSPQPAATTTTQDASGSVVDAAKAEGSANSALTTAVEGAVHDRSALAAAGSAPADSSNAGVQAMGTFGPQPSAAAAASAKNGKSSFDIRLDPAELGRIDVRIDVDRSGQVTSHLTVEKPETLSMLQQDAPQLQRALDDAGLKTGSGGLQFSLRDQSSSSQNNGNQAGGNSQRLVVSEEDIIPAAVAGRTYGRMLGSSSGVDIRV